MRGRWENGQDSHKAHELTAAPDKEMTVSTNDEHVEAYRLQLRGRVDADFVTSFCPQGTTLRLEDSTTVLENIQTDQSGIVGLIRHLHNLGCVILAFQRD